MGRLSWVIQVGQSNHEFLKRRELFFAVVKETCDDQKKGQGQRDVTLLALKILVGGQELGM